MQISIYYQEGDQYLLDKVESMASRERRSKSSTLLSILEEYFESGNKIGEILKDMKAINRSQLHKALSIQRNSKEEKKRLGEILLEKEFISEAQLDRALEVQLTLNNGGAQTSPVQT